jgi:SnoaL-like domain
MTHGYNALSVQALSDRAAIHDLLLRYFRGCDRGDIELMKECFFDDAHVDYGFFYSGPVSGFIEAAESPAALAAYERTLHFVGNILIELDGDTARSETYTIAHHVTNEQHEWAGAFVLVYMRYIDDFQRRDDRWGVARRVVSYEWLRRDTGGGFEPFPAGTMVGTRDRGDPIWTPAIIA